MTDTLNLESKAQCHGGWGEFYSHVSSSTGTEMVFQSERDSENPFYQIFLMDMETGDVERISPGNARAVLVDITLTLTGASGSVVDLHARVRVGEGL